MMKTSASVLGSAAIALSAMSFGGGPKWQVLSDVELNAARGGAICYVNGAAQCPAPQGSCSDTQCIVINMVEQCPLSATEEQRIIEQYRDVQVSNEDSGHEGFRTLDPIDCLAILDCDGCSGGVCDPTGIAVGTTGSRTPTEEDTETRACNY